MSCTCATDDYNPMEHTVDILQLTNDHHHQDHHHQDQLPELQQQEEDHEEDS